MSGYSVPHKPRQRLINRGGIHDANALERSDCIKSAIVQSATIRVEQYLHDTNADEIHSQASCVGAAILKFESYSDEVATREESSRLSRAPVILVSRLHVRQSTRRKTQSKRDRPDQQLQQAGSQRNQSMYEVRIGKAIGEAGQIVGVTESEESSDVAGKCISVEKAFQIRKIELAESRTGETRNSIGARKLQRGRLRVEVIVLQCSMLDKSMPAKGGGRGGRRMVGGCVGEGGRWGG